MSLKVCQDWGLPFLSLDDTPAGSIGEVARGSEPRVVLATISTVADELVQKQLRRLPIRTICLDEVQVGEGKNFDVNHAIPQR